MYPIDGVNQFARLIRVFRLVRAIKSISMISHAINENKASTSLHFMVVTSLMMMLFGSIYILYLEKDMPGTNIHNAGDAFWWTFVTVTTVDLMLYKNFVGVDNGHTEMVDLQSLKASASYSRVRLNQQN
ncbi:ion transporter [Vibrio parahaemolyticus]|uniref:Putative integral membrane protein n=4 Tax=Gammaproteobacteria TaxID=1236 RepID=Q87GD5_VIBPA|nr:ion transporter [Vibrio parahaemolyticus]BAC62725.1 putative integral membrane protein [Vibrio parahaemolyticus RIMD 2210633]